MIARDIFALMLFSVIALFGLLCLLCARAVQRWVLHIRASGASETNSLQRRITAWIATNEYLWCLRSVGAIAILMFALVLVAFIRSTLE